jgi:hypothetical protein
VSGWEGLRSPCGLRLELDPGRFDEILFDPPEPAPPVTHALRKFYDAGDPPLWRKRYFVECACGSWSSAWYPTAREADLAGELHLRAMGGEQ